jgi:hypothetical protein
MRFVMHLWQNNQSHENLAAGANESVGYRTAAAFNCSWQQSSQPHERVGDWAHASLMLIAPLNDLSSNSAELENVRQQKSCDDRAENTDDDISDEAETSAGINKSCEPASDRPDQEHHDNTNRIHALPPFLIRASKVCASPSAAIGAIILLFLIGLVNRRSV